MAEAKFETLFREELEILYDAEKQIVAVLPKMIAAASSEELSGALQDHLDETKQQVVRLDRIFEAMGEEAGAREGQGMQGLLQEGENLIAKLEKSAVLDIGLINAAQKVENYEICGYGTVRALAEMLGQQEAAELLEETLEEESAAADILTDLAEVILSGEDTSDEEQADSVEEEEEIVEERAEGGKA